MASEDEHRELKSPDSSDTNEMPRLALNVTRTVGTSGTSHSLQQHLQSRAGPHFCRKWLAYQ